MKLELTHVGQGRFAVQNLDTGARYVVYGEVERDGREYDDPVYWSDITIYNEAGDIVDSDGLLGDAIFEQLNDDWLAEADQIATEDWVVAAEFASDYLQDR